MLFTTEEPFEVAIESWPGWDLIPRPLNSVQTLQPAELSDHELTRTQSQLCTATPISSFVQCQVFISAIAFVSRHVYFNRVFLEVIT